MSASCQKIDLPSWPRRDIFSFFSVLDQPFYSVCFRVDVTQLHAYTKTHGLSFYYVMTYLVTQAVNEVENLRYTIRDDSVCLLDKRTPSFTELKKGSEQFQIITCPCEGTLAAGQGGAGGGGAGVFLPRREGAERSADLVFGAVLWNG